MKKDNLTLLENKNNEFGTALAFIKRTLPEILEMQIIVAEITDARFKALVARGFTQEQALELCKGISITSF